MKNLQELRKEKGLSQSQLAELSGINIRMIQGYEQGSKNLKAASAITILKLSEVLKINPKELIGPISFKLYVLTEIYDSNNENHVLFSYSKDKVLKYINKNYNHTFNDYEIRVYEMSKIYPEETMNYSGSYNGIPDDYESFNQELINGGLKCGYNLFKIK